jgi:hypothetical protein
MSHANAAWHNPRFLTSLHRLAHIMLSVRLRKIGSLLGLLAILMSTLAPTISQALTRQQQLDHALATYCTVLAAADASAPHGDPSHSSALHWQACPYCGLMTHLPALPGGAAPLAVAQSVAPAPIATASPEVRAPRAHTAAQPRAPPAFSSL